MSRLRKRPAFFARFAAARAKSPSAAALLILSYRR